MASSNRFMVMHRHRLHCARLVRESMHTLRGGFQTMITIEPASQWLPPLIQLPPWSPCEGLVQLPLGSPSKELLMPDSAKVESGSRFKTPRSSTPCGNTLTSRISGVLLRFRG